MAYIKVDHSKFFNAANEIDSYVKLMKDKMKQAQDEVLELSSNWQGSDYVQLKYEFDKVDDNDSIHMQMIKSLESYSNYLRYAAEKYRDVQSKAVNRANSLPK